MKLKYFIFTVLLLACILTRIEGQDDGEDPDNGGDDTTAPPDSDGDGDGEGEVTEPSEEDNTTEPSGDDETTEGGGGDETTTPPSDGSEVTTCGGVLSGLTGTISYKLGQPFNNSERCTWTIYAENAGNITFTLEDNGIIQKMEDNIKIGYFKDTVLSQLSNYKEIQFQHLTPKSSITVEGPLAFVRFYSDAKIRGLGFKVTYAATNLVEPVNVTKFTNAFYDTDSGSIQYTASTNLERATFTIKPTVDVTLGLRYFSGTCMGYGLAKDSLTFYKRGRYGSTKMDWVQQFCNSTWGNVANWKVVGSSEEIFVTFMTSSDTVTNNEIQMMWAPIL